MDLKEYASKFKALLVKYKYPLIIILAGLALMLIPTQKQKQITQLPQAVVSQNQHDPTEALTEILAQIHGVGEVRVLLTVGAGEKTVYQTDSDSRTDENSSTLRVETVIITDADRAQQGLVSQIIAPEYRGAVVVCQGASDPNVKLAVMEAVRNATGLSFDKICVLKMK